MNDEPSVGPAGPNDPRSLPRQEGTAVDEDLLSAWALGALDAEEDEQVVVAIAADRGLAERAAQMEEVVAVLASVSVVPPAGMRQRVLAALDDVPQLPVVSRAGTAAPAAAPAAAAGAPSPVAPVPADRPGGSSRDDASPARAGDASPAPIGDLAASRRRREALPTRRTALRGLAVAAVGAVVGAAGVGAWQASRRDPESFEAVRDRIASAPDVTTVVASDATGAWVRTELRYSGSVGQAVVVSSQPLPAASGGVYQLWRQSGPDAVPTPLGAFEGGDGVVVAGGVAGSSVLAVTRESGPGATAPSVPVLAHYRLDA